MNDRKSIMLAGLHAGAKILEVGPLASPIAPHSEGWNTYSIDHMSTAELKVKYQEDPHINIDNIVNVDFVTNNKQITDIIPKEHHLTFDACIASHVIEHIPDFISFISQVEKLLNNEGKLILAIPDKRFCFDIFKPYTLTSDILESFYQKRSIHSSKTRFEQVAYSVTSNGKVAWDLHENRRFAFTSSSLVSAEQSFNNNDQTYQDCHALYCTPESFRLIILELNALKYISLNIQSISDTIGFEFFVTLTKQIEDNQNINLKRLELLENIYALDTNNEKYKKNVMPSTSIKYQIKILKYTLIKLIKLITKRVSDEISSRR